MAGHASKNIDAATLWGGKVSPFSVSYGKLMMWFFLVSDALTFGGLLISYGYFRHSTVEYWPTGEEVFNSLPFLGHGYPLIYVALMTFILIISSVTMVLAVEAGHRMDKRGVVKWMAATIIGGFIFLGSQAWEWGHFIHGSEFGKVIVASPLTVALMVGMSVTDVSQKAIANLGWDDIRMTHPLFVGDTLYCESEVLDKRESKSRPNQGIVTVKTIGFNQDGVQVSSFVRKILVMREGNDAEDKVNY